MTRADKALARLCANPRPKDFTWDELVTVLARFEYRLEQDGSSHCKFLNANTGVSISLSRPHGGKPELKAYQVRQVVEHLTEHGYL